MFFFSNYFYFITLALQAICVWHCVRKGNKQTNWIWLIVFLPVIGSIIYIFTEMFSRRDIQKVQSGIGTVFNPSGAIRKLEANLSFSDTFNNRVALADAYMKADQTERAIALYESSLTGNFDENEYVLMQLVTGYYRLKLYNDVILTAQKVYDCPQFARSRPHLQYAMALGYTGQNEKAENEFMKMKTRFSNFESRYQYGRFLADSNRHPEAKQVLKEMLDEFPHLSGVELRDNRNWFALAKEELKKINT
jgi:hypothetical protein